jgi:hypothetical protein
LNKLLDAKHKREEAERIEAEQQQARDEASKAIRERNKLMFEKRNMELLIEDPNTDPNDVE